MEILLELLASSLVEVCCQGVLTGAVDVLAGTAVYNTHKKRDYARKHGEPPPPPDLWSRMSWVLLPLAVLLTAFLIGSFIWRRRL